MAMTYRYWQALLKSLSKEMRFNKFDLLGGLVTIGGVIVVVGVVVGAIAGVIALLN